MKLKKLIDQRKQIRPVLTFRLLNRTLLIHTTKLIQYGQSLYLIRNLNHLMNFFKKEMEVKYYLRNKYGKNIWALRLNAFIHVIGINIDLFQSRPNRSWRITESAKWDVINLKFILLKSWKIIQIFNNEFYF